MVQTSSTKNAFELAKDALRLIGQFKTPPTPTVFGVWYRYVEGLNEDLIMQMTHAVNDAKSVSVEMLESIHEQYCETIDETTANVGESLVFELDRFQRLVDDQKAAGNEFEGTLESAGELLNADNASSQKTVACVAALTAGAAMMKRQLSEASKELDAARSQISKLQNDLVTSQRGMLTDHLTGIGNRRYFDSMVKNLLSNSGSRDLNLYLAVLDLDRFKLVNDTFGHDAGDQVLRYFVSQISLLYPDMPLARLGGDEFAAFLQFESQEDAQQYADDLRDHFIKQKLKLSSTQTSLGSIRFSMGIAKLRASDDGDSWHKRADDYLYQAKDLGRDRVVIERMPG